MNNNSQQSELDNSKDGSSPSPPYSAAYSSNLDHIFCPSNGAAEDPLGEENKQHGEGTASLKFGIDNILHPAFGTTKTGPERSPPSSLDAFPTIPLEICCMPSILPPPNESSLPSWIFCTRYSDRPSSGPRIRKAKRREFSEEEKRPRTAFTAEQLERLKSQFLSNRYLTEKRRQELAHELGLNESQIKIWFQNKRAKLKKSSQRAHQSVAVLQQLMSQGGVYQR